jgi:hypothetical protein
MPTGCRSAARGGLIGSPVGEVRQGYAGSIVGNVLKGTGRVPVSSSQYQEIPHCLSLTRPEHLHYYPRIANGVIINGTVRVMGRISPFCGAMVRVNCW